MVRNYLDDELLTKGEVARAKACASPQWRNTVNVKTSLALVLVWCVVEIRSSSITIAVDDTSPTNEVDTIAFGSCRDAHRHGIDLKAPWEAMNRLEPDAVVLLGDNFYGDYKEFYEWKTWSTWPPTIFRPATLQRLEDGYATLANEKGFDALRNDSLLFATWDDHDFGRNDGDRTYPLRHESQRLFLDFMNVAEDSPQRGRQGVYSSHMIGPVGRRIHLILLDVRFNKDPWGKKGDVDRDEGDMLGAEQWSWLQQQLSRDDPGDFTMIGSGIQILPTDKTEFMDAGETWARFPHQREKLLTSILGGSAKRVLLLSGDIHFAEANAVRCQGRDLVEITSSGLTHSWGRWGPEPVGSLFSVFFQFTQWCFPWSFRVGDFFSREINFATLSIDWEKMEARADLHSHGGAVVGSHTVAFEQGDDGGGVFEMDDAGATAASGCASLLPRPSESGIIISRALHFSGIVAFFAAAVGTLVALVWTAIAGVRSVFVTSHGGKQKTS